MPNLTAETERKNEMTETNTLGLGREINNPNVSDWVDINTEATETPAWNGVRVCSTYQYSPSARAFRQTGGNSNGDAWERFYAAVPAPINSYPAHILEVADDE